MAVPKKFTRSMIDCPLFGHPKELPVSKLPTYEEVIRCCLLEQYNLASKTAKSASFSLVSNVVAKEIIALYEKASIPTVTPYRVVQLINSYHSSYRTLMKSYKRDAEKENFKKKVEVFKKKCFVTL